MKSKCFWTLNLILTPLTVLKNIIQEATRTAWIKVNDFLPARISINFYIYNSYIKYVLLLNHRTSVTGQSVKRREILAYLSYHNLLLFQCYINLRMYLTETISGEYEKRCVD